MNGSFVITASTKFRRELHAATMTTLTVTIISHGLDEVLVSPLSIDSNVMFFGQSFLHARRKCLQSSPTVARDMF